MVVSIWRPEPPSPRILEHRPLEIDTLVDDWVLPARRPGVAPTRAQQLLRDSVHFGLSMGNEIASILMATPSYFAELVRQGVYPKRMSYRKLPYRGEMANLSVLREANPGWIFREDFEPRRWVFVFLHGYVDNTGGDRVAFKLAQLGYQVYLVRYPFLSSVRDLADQLDETIQEIAALEPGKRLVPIGHSLGGFIWDHLLLHRPEIVEHYRIPLYIPMGSPHFGTVAAYFGVGASAREMRPHSDLVAEHLSRDFPEDLEVYPFVSRFDLLVLPIETALLKRGINYVLSETGHVAQVIRSSIVTAIEEIIASPPEVLLQRAEYRPFYPSSLAGILSRLPRVVRERLGVQGILDYIGHQGGQTRFRVRIVRHELGLGIFPALRRP